MNKTLDRRRGCLYGLAIGDALGAAVEFRDPGTFPLVTCYRDGGPHSLAKGQWTDDTSMALALAHSMGKKWDLADQLTEYLDWFQNGKYSVNGFCFDIGCTTRDALMNFERMRDPETCADSSPHASGNGSIMRLAPVPVGMFWTYEQGQWEILEGMAMNSSRTTHASEQCKSACRYMALVLAGLMNGEERDVVLSPDWEVYQKMKAVRPLDPMVEKVAEGSYRNKMPCQIKGSGWVVASLEAALWAFHDAANFEEAVLRAVNLGDDADSTGAVCGQFAGAYWGESGIPYKLVDGLARKDMIEAALDAINATKDYIDIVVPPDHLINEDGTYIGEMI